MFYAMQKSVYNGVSLEVESPFDFQPMSNPVQLSSFHSNTLNVGW